MPSRMITRLESGIGPANHAKFITFKFGGTVENELSFEAVYYALDHAHPESNFNFFSDQDAVFHYKGATLKPIPLRKPLGDIVNHINIALGAKYNSILSVFCNYTNDSVDFEAFDTDDILILECSGKREKVLKTRPDAPHGAVKLCSTGEKMWTDDDNCFLMHGKGFQKSYTLSISRTSLEPNPSSIYFVFMTIPGDSNTPAQTS